MEKCTQGQREQGRSGRSWEQASTSIVFCCFDVSAVLCGPGGSISKYSSPPQTTMLKLQLYYRTIITQNWQLNGSLTTTELKKPQLCRLVGGVEMQIGLVPYTRVVDKNSGEISWERGVLALYQAPQPRVPVPGR